MSGDGTSIGDRKEMVSAHASRTRRYKWGSKNSHEAHDLRGGNTYVGTIAVLFGRQGELILAEFGR